jgi:hypothetical protein
MTNSSHVQEKSSLAELEHIVHLGIQQFSHHISAADIGRQFSEGKMAANVARQQQTGHLQGTIFTLGLLSAALSLPKGKTREGAMCGRNIYIWGVGFIL